MTSLFSLAERVALVTGASRGLGFEMARALAGAGAHVILNGRNPETLAERVRALEAEGLSASAAAFDVTDEAAGAAAIADIAAAHGRLDILVNNAGIIHRAPIAEFAVADWRRVIETNLTACYALSRAAARVMVPRGAGRIILNASVLARVARPTVVAYVAAKTGLAGLTRALAVELGPAGVTCNAIAPGYFATEINADLKADPEFDAFVRARTPLGRWGDPPELGGIAVFLASDAAAYVNGHLLVVDGGMSAAL